MAEGGLLSSLEDDMLCCSVCMEHFEDPRALPCLHTFCYKCLVQLSKPVDKVELSDIKVQLTELKLESGSSVSTSTEPKQEKILRCPLCAEEHPIPLGTGIHGFRKDFRINSLIDQQKYKSIDMMTESLGEKIEEKIFGVDQPEVHAEKCLYHPDEDLLYHCESDTCKYDICKECWSANHDSHVVKLLSKMVNGAKEALLQEMENNIFQVSSQLDALAATQEDLSQQNEEIVHEIKQRYAGMQEKLQNTFQETSQEFYVHKKLQEKKISDELQSLLALEDTFKQIKSGIDNENLPPTSKVSQKYEGLQDKVKELTEDLISWSFSYNKAQLPEYNPSDSVQNPVSVTYEEANVDLNEEDYGEEYSEDYDEEYDEDYDGEYDEEGYANEDYNEEDYDYENEEYENDEVEEEFEQEYAEEDCDDEELQNITEAVLNTCLLHNGERKNYYCGTCKSDICQECWATTHDAHVVKLLSKKLDEDEKGPTGNLNMTDAPRPQSLTEQDNRWKQNVPAAAPMNLVPQQRPPMLFNYGHPFVQPTPNLQMPPPVYPAQFTTTYNQFVRYPNPSPTIRLSVQHRAAGRGGRGHTHRGSHHTRGSSSSGPKHNTSRGAPRGGRGQQTRRYTTRGGHSPSNPQKSSSGQSPSGGSSRGRGQRAAPRGGAPRGAGRGSHHPKNSKPNSPNHKASSGGQSQKARGGSNPRGNARGGRSPNKSKPNTSSQKPSQGAHRGGRGRGQGSRGGGSRGRGQRGGRGTAK